MSVSRNIVEPTMSVNINVTMPVGGWMICFLLTFGVSLSDSDPSMPDCTPACGSIVPDHIDARVDADRVAEASLHRKRIEQTAARVAGVEIAAWSEDWVRPLQQSAEGELPEQ